MSDIRLVMTIHNASPSHGLLTFVAAALPLLVMLGVTWAARRLDRRAS